MLQVVHVKEEKLIIEILRGLSIEDCLKVLNQVQEVIGEYKFDPKIAYSDETRNSRF